MDQPYWERQPEKPEFRRPPKALSGPIPGPVILRLMNKIKVNSMGGLNCWEYQGFRNKKGYGIIKYNGSAHLAHRVAFVAFVADLPHGQTVDHTCLNTSCCNPDHLRVLSLSENSSDSNRRTGFRGNGSTKEQIPF